MDGPADLQGCVLSLRSGWPVLALAPNQQRLSTQLPTPNSQLPTLNSQLPTPKIPHTPQKEENLSNKKRISYPHAERWL
ncbi:hypothetical protein FD744_24840 [Pantoea sp. Taur]|nr:hypothetical protein [Pantoea sp. Taur]